MKIPRWTEIPDYFVWDAFDWGSRDPSRRLGRDALQQEALLAETASFYVVPDQFGVVSGHVLILPKKEVTSIAGLDSSFDGELTWFVHHVSHLVRTVYEAGVVVAEHGECGCATADQAHIHVIPIPRSITSQRLKHIIDNVLQRRTIGIDRIIYRGVEFTALEDIHALINVDGVEITGQQVRYSDLANGEYYPAVARVQSGLIRPYVYFSGPGVNFVSTCSFRSQFVREVVSIATSLTHGTWDRRGYTDRRNMFDTFDRLALIFAQSQDSAHGFRARVACSASDVDNVVPGASYSRRRDVLCDAMA